MPIRSRILTSSALCLILILAGCGGTPEQKEARYLKHGNELFDAGDYEKARVEYRNAARAKPTDPEIGYR
ncbi:MAG TPA: tetratricopeptide repeat protein, partial [Alphaproteobacteria bacterium]|nr:tetratricopeptide repeat protein [Alphaproteobacteria bacterium]